MAAGLGKRRQGHKVDNKAISGSWEAVLNRYESMTIHEMPQMRTEKLAEESGDERRSGVAASRVMIIAGSISALKNGEGDPLAIALIMSGCVIVVAPALIGVGIEVKTGYYKCTECGHFYKPSSFLKTTLAMHMNTTRYMRCLSAENAVGRKKC